MKLDEGTYVILQSAQGAYACRTLPIPKHWNPISRPHVALLIPDNGKVFKLYLSEPNLECTLEGNPILVSDFDTIPDRAIIEIRYTCLNYCFYRRDRDIWIKVAEADSPFIIEVFSYGYDSIIVETSPFPQVFDFC
ncbi:MAG: hypothetical protein GF411_09980 [Candidatus Lokiarchaeota archaeon]|nr:hypothetical protein [Candidatus Lokiarchaeota archaeon]